MSLDVTKVHGKTALLMASFAVLRAWEGLNVFCSSKLTAMTNETITPSAPPPHPHNKEEEEVRVGCKKKGPPKNNRITMKAGNDLNMFWSSK